MLGLHLSPHFKQYIIVLSVNLGVLSFALSLGWSSPVLVKLRHGNQTILSEPLTKSAESWIVSGGFLASIFGMFLPPFLLDSIGRKRCVILSYFPHLAACVMFQLASKTWVLIVGRVLTGVSMSIVFSVVPTYAAEMASKEIRGTLGVIFQMSCCTGILIMLSVGPFVTYWTLSTMYTAIVVLAAVPSLFLPDSPYFLYSKGKTSEALEILTSLRGSECLAQQEIEEYKLANSNNNLVKSALLRDIVFLKTVVIVVIFAIIGHLSGGSAIIYYLQSIFDSTKTSVSSEVSSAAIGSVKVIATIFTALTTDRFGRKPILIWTWVGKAVGMIGLGTYFHEWSPHMSGFVNYIPLLCIILIIFCHNAGQNSLFFVVSTELFEGPSRAVGVTAGIFAATTFNFLMAMYLSSVLEAWGPAVTYWSFGVICALSVLFLKLFLPETKGMTFAEIQKQLGRRR